MALRPPPFSLCFKPITALDLSRKILQLYLAPALLFASPRPGSQDPAAARVSIRFAPTYVVYTHYRCCIMEPLVESSSIIQLSFYYEGIGMAKGLFALERETRE